MDKIFSDIASKCAHWMGEKWAFFIALLMIVVWAVTGPLFHYSDTWELVINTATTIVTFLMVFLIQNTQNRDAQALHLKLDELIFALKEADNRMLNIEHLSTRELNALGKKYDQIHEHLEKTFPAPGTERVKA